MKFKFLTLGLFIFSLEAANAPATTTLVDLQSGNTIGRISFKQTSYGVVFTPYLMGLPAGLHGFHIHENPSCESSLKNGHVALGGKAGGHYDPFKTGKHGNPWDENSHMGDLPTLFVGEDGRALQPVLAPRLKREDLTGKALMVHSGGDNHADHPLKLGGGGARIACGVILE